MAIARSIESRLAEAVWTVLAADSDLSALCNGRVQLGPLALDPSLISPPQINVQPVPTGDEIGIGGVSDASYQIEILYFEPALKSRTPIAAGATNNGPDVMAHIEKVLIIGKGTADTDASQQGYLLDPDDSSRNINQLLESFRRERQIPTKEGASLAWPMIVTYSIRQNKLRQLA